jgi:hypothetical protein
LRGKPLVDVFDFHWYPQKDAEQAMQEVAKAIQDLREEIKRQDGFWELGPLRDPIKAFLRTTGKFPDFLEVGIDVWQQVYDWHVRYQQPLMLGRTGGMTRKGPAAADFETGDAPSAVADFYKSKVPGANVISSEADHYAIISTDKKNMLTISIEPKDGKTRIHIAKVSGKLVDGGDSDN